MEIKQLFTEIKDYNFKICQLLDIVKNILNSYNDSIDKLNLSKSKKPTIKQLTNEYKNIVDLPTIEYNTKIKQVKQSKKNKIDPVIEKLKPPIKKIDQIYNSIVDKPTETMTIFEKLEEPEQYDIKEIEDLIKQVQNTKINKKIDTNIINKQIEEIEKMKLKKPKTVYDPKKIEKNKKLINDYTFNEKMSDKLLLEGAKNLFKLQKKGGDDDDVSQFSIVYLQKEPSPKELEQLREVFKIKQKK